MVTALGDFGLPFWLHQIANHAGMVAHMILRNAQLAVGCQLRIGKPILCFLRPLSNIIFLRLSEKTLHSLNLNWNRYHVPRSILKSDNNSLVLLEEMGGSPFNVNFQTVTVGTVCAGVPMGDVLELECASDSSISSIEFASLKPTNGTCGSYVGPSDGALLNYVQQVFHFVICTHPFVLFFFSLHNFVIIDTGMHGSNKMFYPCDTKFTRWPEWNHPHSAGCLLGTAFFFKEHRKN